MDKQINIVQEISLLYELSLAIGTSIDLEESSNHFLKTLVSRKNYTYASLWLKAEYLLGAGTGFHQAYSQPEFHFSGVKIEEDHLIWSELQEKSQFSIHVKDKQPSLVNIAQGPLQEKGAFLYFQLEELGFLEIYAHHKEDIFSQQEINQLRQVIKKFTNSLKGSISHRRFEEALNAKTLYAHELNTKRRHLQTINTFATSLLNKNSISDIVEEITESVINQFGFVDCIVYLLDESGEYLYQAAAFGDKLNEDGSIFQPILIPVGQGIVGTVAKTGVAEIVNDTTQDPRYIADDVIRYSELTVPIIADGEVIGVIDSEHPQQYFFTQEHLENIGIIANLAAAKIKNALSQQAREIAEIALRDNQAKIRAIIDSALDAVITIDGEGRVTDWNNQASRIFGWERNEIIGLKLSDTIIPHAFRKSHEEGMDHFHKTGEGPVLHQRIEIIGMHRSGKEFPIELAIVPVKVQEEYVFSAFVRDITNRKEAEERREKLLKQLEEANSELKDFAYIVSHDLKAPLRAIGSLAHWIAEDYEALFDEEGQEQLRLMIGRVGRMNDLINGILDYSRVGRSHNESEWVDLQALLENLIASLDIPANYEVELSGNFPTVFINPIRIQQVFQNLISNSLKYIDKPKGKVEIGTNEQAKEWVFWVKDNGPGIDPKYHERIFRIFQTLRPRDEVEATGVGLSIVKKTLGLYQGEIWVESSLGEGSTFKFSLPKEINLSNQASS